MLLGQPAQTELTPCRLCEKLPGCPLLTGRNGQFLVNRVIDETRSFVCAEFKPVGEQENKTREEMRHMLGTGFIRAIHVLERESLEDIEEDDMSEVPDFAGMIYEEMTVEDRLEQFQYLTDDDGNFLADGEGNRIPRGQIPIRKYASDPEGPLCQLKMTDADTVAFWDFDKVLDILIKTEKKLYGLGKPAKKTTTKKRAAKAATTQEKEKKMAQPQRIMLRRPGTGKATPKNGEDKSPAKVKTKGGGNGKVTKAATAKKKPGRKPNGAAKAAAETDGNGETHEDHEGTPGFGLEAIEALIETKVAEATQPINEKLDAVLAAIGEGPNGRTLADTVTAGQTVLHDCLQQKLSNVYFGLIADPDTGKIADDAAFPFLENEDGRDRLQNLLETGEPTDIISYYLDGESGEEEAAED